MGHALSVVKPLVLLQREAIRLARRPRTWGLRVGLAGLATLVFWFGWAVIFDRRMGVQDIAGHTRELYYTWLTVTWMAVFVVSPVTAALAIHEEQEDNTLELLALSGLSARQVVFGKVGSRMLGLFSVVLGMAPLLALLASFGGVAPSEVVVAEVQMLWSAVLMAAVTATVAPVMRGVLAASAVGWLWGLVASGLPVLALAGLTHGTFGRDPSDGWLMAFCPPYAAVGASWSGLGSLVLFSPVLLVASALVPVAMRRGTGSGRWLTSPEGRRFDRLVAWTGLSLPMLAAASALPWLVMSQWQSVRAAELVIALWIAVGHMLFLALFLAATIEVVTGLRARSQRSGRPSRSERLGRNPISWRARFTDGISPGRLAFRVGLATQVLLGMATIFASEGDRGGLYLWLWCWFHIGLGAVGLVAVGTTLVDAKDENSALLRVTTMSASDLVHGQLTSIAVTCVPVALLAWLPWAGGRLVEASAGGRHPGYFPQTVADLVVSEPVQPFDLTVAFLHVVDALAIGVWVAVVYLAFALATIVLAQRVRPSRLAWVGGAMLVPGLWFFQGIVAIFDGCADSDGVLSFALMPLYNPDIVRGHPVFPLGTLFSIGAWAVVAVLFGGLAMAWWRPEPSPRRLAKTGVPDGDASA